MVVDLKEPPSGGIASGSFESVDRLGSGPSGVQGHAGFNKATADEVTGSFATSCGVWKQLRLYINSAYSNDAAGHGLIF
ncbi:hypothetical protein WJX82_009231 [Trebouxia sp. C0006]